MQQKILVVRMRKIVSDRQGVSDPFSTACLFSSCCFASEDYNDDGIDLRCRELGLNWLARVSGLKLHPDWARTTDVFDLSDSRTGAVPDHCMQSLCCNSIRKRKRSTGVRRVFPTCSCQPVRAVRKIKNNGKLISFDPFFFSFVLLTQSEACQQCSTANRKREASNPQRQTPQANLRRILFFRSCSSRRARLQSDPYLSRYMCALDLCGRVDVRCVCVCVTGLQPI